MRPLISAERESEHPIMTFGKKETKLDEVVKCSDECVREPLVGGFGKSGPPRSTTRSKDSPQTQAPATGKSARVAIKVKGRILFMDAADIIAIEARGNYVLLSHTSGSHMLRGSISAMEEKLNFHGLVRIHRSVLINAALVEWIHPCPTGEYLLRVRGGREFRVTRAYKKNLPLLAQLWIGMEES
jgi:DNA-binding LytR/AlgR family response regulator